MNKVPKPEDKVETKYDMAIHFGLPPKGQKHKQSNHEGERDS